VSGTLAGYFLFSRSFRHHIPKAWVEDVQKRVDAGREFQDAVREVLAANAQLLVLSKKQQRR